MGILTRANIPTSLLYIYTTAIPNDVSTEDIFQGNTPLHETSREHIRFKPSHSPVPSDPHRTNNKTAGIK